MREAARARGGPAAATPRTRRFAPSSRSIAGDDPDGDFAAALQRERQGAAADRVFVVRRGRRKRRRCSPDRSISSSITSVNEPLFPLQPTSGAAADAASLAEAAAGLGHVNIAFDRDGAPRYDYLALPFDGDFVPSLPVRAAAAYLGVPWSEVGLALGDGVTDRRRLSSRPTRRCGWWSIIAARAARSRPIPSPI